MNVASMPFYISINSLHIFMIHHSFCDNGHFLYVYVCVALIFIFCVLHV